MNILKAFKALSVPAYWKGLVRGVVPTIDHAEAFAGLEFASVVDVGANVGQFSLFAAHRWPDATIHAFEPLPDQAAKFLAVHTSRVRLYPFALGASDETTTIHVASRRDSSSLLPLGDKQKALFEMDEVASFSVSVKRLDEVLSQAELSQPSLLEIDVQGFEYEVLRGAEGVLKYFSHVYVEASYVELYVGQRLFPEIAELLESAGFKQVKRVNISRDRTGSDIQADVLFCRQGGVAS